MSVGIPLDPVQAVFTSNVKRGWGMFDSTYQKLQNVRHECLRHFLPSHCTSRNIRSESIVHAQAHVHVHCRPATPMCSCQRRLTAAHKAEGDALKGLVTAGQVLVHAVDCQAQKLIVLQAVCRWR